MADVIQAGIAWLAGQLRAHASVPVTYRRGALAVGVPATIGKTLLKLDDGAGGVRMEWTERDFLIPAADLIFPGSGAGSGPVEPQRGDLIDDGPYTYEALNYGGSEPVWRWSDPHRTIRRVHTKQVVSAPGG